MHTVYLEKQYKRNLENTNATSKLQNELQKYKINFKNTKETNHQEYNGKFKNTKETSSRIQWKLQKYKRNKTDYVVVFNRWHNVS